MDVSSISDGDKVVDSFKDPAFESQLSVDLSTAMTTATGQTITLDAVTSADVTAADNGGTAAGSDLTGVLVGVIGGVAVVALVAGLYVFKFKRTHFALPKQDQSVEIP